MFGTGELASSANESTSPSCTSSSCRSGTYCRQMGSRGDVMRSTMAGEIRNSKFSAACRSRSRSGKCSAPNLATSASSEAMLCLRSSCCQDSMRQILEIDHQVVAGGVVAREPGRLGVAAPLVEGARSEEHTSELQSRLHLVCRLLLEKKKQTNNRPWSRPSR